MATTSRILAFSGSARRDSWNKKFLAVAVQEARAAGADVTLIELNDFPLPLYHGDLEGGQGMPENAKKLVSLVSQHAALLIASPEYNSMITPLLKNTFDWCTRGDEDPFPGKVAAVISASPGIFGGVRSLQMAQQLLLKLGCHIVPGQCVLPRAHEAFDESGALKEARTRKAVKTVVDELLRTVGRFAG